METIKMGPVIGCRCSGYYSKTDWDDMGNNIISHIIVSYSNNGVRSIQFGYVNNGALAISKTYGPSVVGCSTRIVRLKHESEFVTGLSGEVFKDYITSLTFHTNQRKHEVFHLTFERDSIYGFPRKIELCSGILERREFGGFFGSYDKSYFLSIGFDVRIVLPDDKMIKEEKI